MSLDLARVDNDALAIASHVNEIRQLGETLIESGLLPGAIKKPEAAVAIILKGRELGLPVMQAFDSIDSIQGKPTLKPQAMLALIYASPQCAGVDIDSRATQCTVTMRRRNSGRESAHTETFTMEDASRLGLANKDNWRKQPKTMLKWRAVSACARVVFPDVIQGMFTPEEAASMVLDGESSSPHRGEEPVDAEFQPASRAESLAARLSQELSIDEEFPPEPEGLFGEPVQPEEPQAVEEQPASSEVPAITSGQATALSIALTDAGFKKNQKEQGRSFIAFMAGVDGLESIKDLSKAEAGAVLDALGGVGEDGKYVTDKKRLESYVADWAEAMAGRQLDEEES